MGLEVKQEGGGIEREDWWSKVWVQLVLPGQPSSLLRWPSKNWRGEKQKKTKRIDPISLYVSNSSSSNYICTTITIHTLIYTHSPPVFLFQLAAVSGASCTRVPPPPSLLARNLWTCFFDLRVFFRVHVLLLSSFILLLHVPSQFDKKRKKKDKNNFCKI